MNIQKLRNLKYLPVIGLCLTSTNLMAGELDLTPIAKYQVRDRLETVLPKICAGLEIPALTLSRPANSNIQFNVRYHLPDLEAIQSDQPGLPTFSMAFRATPNITLAGQLGSGRWQDESLNSSGLFIAYFWRNSTRPDQIICGITHVNGPNDFHFRDISLGYLKIIPFRQWNFSIAATLHTTRIGIHVTDSANSDDNYKTIKKVEFGLMNISLDRKIGEHFKIGTICTFNSRNFRGGLAFGGYF
ncbi:MAG: hypothetical protein M0R34_02635 [Candidatus Marinimicrobia bacterium]|nr:hypothetical protein [Candidatus Neomarinimicrobiota bacterium]